MELNSFVPARSKAEAVARLYALAGAPPEPLGPGSKEKKSALTTTASALTLAVDLDARKDELAKLILEALHQPWDASYASTGQTVTLRGLNAMIAAAEAEHRLRAELRAVELRGFFPDWFVPARDKLEAVRRISALTHARPQDLGPGSKERKSVLTDLVENLDLAVDTRLPKTKLAPAIVGALHGRWDNACWSSGETITLRGLNAVLAGAEAVALRGPHGRTEQLRQEAKLLAAGLAAECRGHWDGRTCVTEMLDASYPKARQTEWIGWYFEFIGLPALINAYGGGPVRIGHTEFDYRRDFVWDLKSHSQDQLHSPGGVDGEAPLNDRDSIMQCVEETGALGFLVLSGRPTYEAAGEFDAWHRQMRGKPVSSSTRPRRLKVASDPVVLESYVFHGTDDIDEALSSGSLRLFKQGHQPDGSPRKLKLKLELREARDEGRVWASEPLAR